MRTFEGWEDPAPGFMEADLVAHSGPTAKGSFVQTLTLTDIATGWTERAPLLVREQRLLTEVLGEVRKLLPLLLLGFDTDNDSVFMNETVRITARRAASSSRDAARTGRTIKPGSNRRTARWCDVSWATSGSKGRRRQRCWPGSTVRRGCS